MKDYYARMDLSPRASRREIERELDSLGDAALRRQARHVLLDPERRAFYDECHATLRSIGELRARLGLNRSPFWKLSDCDDFTTEAFGRPELRPRRPLTPPLALLLTVAIGAWWWLRPPSEPADPLVVPSTERPTRRITIREAGPDERRSPDDWLAWHARYREQLEPVRRAWSELTGSLDQGSFELADPRCRRLQRAVAACDRGQLLPSPELELDATLGRLLDRLAAVARSCRQGRFFTMTERLDEAQEDWDRVERSLRRRALEP